MERTTQYKVSSDCLSRIAVASGSDALPRDPAPHVKLIGGTRSGAIRRGTFRRVFATCGTVETRSRAIRGSSPDDRVGCSASDGRCAPARPALHVSTRLCRFCHARSRLPIVFGPFHYCTFCERAAPDAPETIDDQRRCTGCRYRTIYGGSRGSASLPAPAKWRGPIIPTVHTNDSTLTRDKTSGRFF